MRYRPPPNNFHFIIKIDDGNFWGWQSQFDGWQAGWMDRNNTSTNDDRMTKSSAGSWAGMVSVNVIWASKTWQKLTDATQEEKDLIKGTVVVLPWLVPSLCSCQYFGGLPYIDKVLPGDEKLSAAALEIQRVC